MSELIQRVADAVNAGAIMVPPSVGTGDAIEMYADVIEDMSHEIGHPTVDEIVGIASAIAQKVCGMAADADATYGGKPMTVSDHDGLVDGMDAWVVVIGDANAIITFDETNALLTLR